MLQLQAARYIILLHSMPSCLLLTGRPGHEATECKANRVFDTSRVADMSAEDAWEALKNADEMRDLEEFREVGTKRDYLAHKTLTFVIRLSAYTLKPLRMPPTMSWKWLFAPMASTRT